MISSQFKYLSIKSHKNQSKLKIGHQLLTMGVLQGTAGTSCSPCNMSSKLFFSSFFNKKRHNYFQYISLKLAISFVSCYAYLRSCLLEAVNVAFRKLKALDLNYLYVKPLRVYGKGSSLTQAVCVLLVTIPVRNFLYARVVGVFL